MDEHSTKGATNPALFAGAAWFDPIEAGLRGRIRSLIEELVEQELEAALGRGRYERGGAAGHRHGHAARTCLLSDVGMVPPFRPLSLGATERPSQEVNNMILCYESTNLWTLARCVARDPARATCPKSPAKLPCDEINSCSATV